MFGLPLGVDSGALSDVLDKLGHTGAVTGLAPLTGHHHVIGRAVTVRLAMVGSERTEQVEPRHLCTAAIEASGQGDVIVVEHPGLEAAGWGGMLSLAARLRGIEGVVVDGPARDIDQARELGFPVFARRATPVTARGRIVEVGWNEPITVGGHPVKPGDLVLADASGVVFIDATHEEAVLLAVAEICERETRMCAELYNGAGVSDVMSGTYERLLEKSDRS